MGGWVDRFRKITVEPVIGQIKENFGFRQFGLRGLEGAKIEINIVAILHNLKKVWKMIGGLRKKCCENLDFEIFVEFYFDMNLIMGQRPLLSSPEYLEGLIFSATFPKGKLKVVVSIVFSGGCRRLFASFF